MSLLKTAVGPPHQVSSELPVLTDAFQIPMKILERRILDNGDRSIAQVLVQWSSWPPSMSTWEDKTMLKQRFPGAPAWGQAICKGRGCKVMDPGMSTVPSARENGTRKEGKAEWASIKRSRDVKPNTRVIGPEWEN